MNVRSRYSVPDEADELQAMIRRIGLARFVGRVNSGVISADVGENAIRRFVDQQRRRPFISRVTHTVCGRTDTYEARTSVF